MKETALKGSGFQPRRKRRYIKGGFKPLMWDSPGEMSFQQTV
jgi:hypothetical protein